MSRNCASPVAATWSLSVELPDDLTPAGVARPVLALASVLDPNGIPTAVFTAPGASSSGSQTRASATGSARRVVVIASPGVVTHRSWLSSTATAVVVTPSS